MFLVLIILLSRHGFKVATKVVVKLLEAPLEMSQVKASSVGAMRINKAHWTSPTKAKMQKENVLKML